MYNNEQFENRDVWRNSIRKDTPLHLSLPYFAYYVPCGFQIPLYCAMCNRKYAE